SIGVLWAYQGSKNEIEQLNTAVSALSDSCFHDFSITVQNATHYVLSFRPCALADVSDLLQVLQRVVRGDRILLNLSR
ncbi:MAG: hypothetical protein ACE5IR_18845, partial [bacterium]